MPSLVCVVCLDFPSLAPAVAGRQTPTPIYIQRGATRKRTRQRKAECLLQTTTHTDSTSLDSTRLDSSRLDPSRSDSRLKTRALIVTFVRLPSLNSQLAADSRLSPHNNSLPLSTLDLDSSQLSCLATRDTLDSQLFDGGSQSKFDSSDRTPPPQQSIPPLPSPRPDPECSPAPEPAPEFEPSPSPRSPHSGASIRARLRR